MGWAGLRVARQLLVATGGFSAQEVAAADRPVPAFLLVGSRLVGVLPAADGRQPAQRDVEVVALGRVLVSGVTMRACFRWAHPFSHPAGHGRRRSWSWQTGEPRTQYRASWAMSWSLMLPWTEAGG